MGRASALKKNMIAGWASEVVALVSGLVLPRLILVAFGSAGNGLLSSIVQFLGFSTLLRAGVGAVTRAALFKPLADKDNKKISEVVSATQSYMNKVSLLIGLYIVILAVVFPFVAKGEYSWWYTFTLTLIIGSSTFIDNLVGIKYRILLQADQKYYIETFCVIISQIASLVVSVVLIKLGQSIHVMKIGAALAMFINPLIITLYTKKNYNLDLSVKAKSNVIGQRWDAFAQQMAIIVNSNVGLTLLSFFVQLKEISVYTVHYLVSHNMEKVIIATVTGINSTFGNIIAKNEEENLKKVFCFIEWGLFVACCVIFSVTAVMITPFVRIYTSGVSDVNYIRPVFAIAMATVAMTNCMRRPYQTLTEAAGHFKQTRNGAIAEVIINIVISIIMVCYFGIIGVAIGSFVASVFRSVQLAVYSMKNIIKLPKYHLFKTYFLYLATYAFITLFCGKVISMPENLNYFTWAGYAVVVGVIALITVVVVSLIFNRDQVKYLKNRMMSKIRK